MTSKNLYFKLMKEDLKSRLWAVCLIGLGFFFLYPIWVAFAAGDIENFQTFEKGIEWYSQEVTGWLSFENGMTVFVMLLTGLICGLSGFSYLNSRSKVDFYHSLPVKREKLFIANYINGILILAVPYAAAMALAVLVGISNGIAGGPLWQTALAAYGLHLTYFILVYTTVVVAVMMTGNLVVAFLGCMVFSFFVPLAAALANGYFGVYFHTYVWDTGEKLMERFVRISPVMEYTYQVSRYAEGETVWTAAVLALIVSAALAALGCFLYRKRPSEAAGKAMAFAASRPVIRILITLISAMGLSVFFWTMRESTGWAVFGVLCGAVISHCVIEIIYHFDFKKLFTNWVQLIGCILVSLAVFFVFRYDLAGYDRYLPSAGKVEGAAVEISRLSDWVSYGRTRHLPDGAYDWEYDEPLEYAVEHMKYTDVENLLSIAAAGMEDTLKDEEGGGVYTDRALPSETIDEGTEDTFSQMTICFTLKGGRKVYRRYVVNLDRIMPQIEKMYASREYLEGAYPVMSMKAEDVSGIYYSEMQKEIRLDKLTQEQKAVILETYQREFAAITPSQMKSEFPSGLIRFSTETDEAGIQWWNRQVAAGFENYPKYRYRGSLTNRSYYPIYPSCTETIKLLKEQQVDAGSYFENMDIQSVTMRWYGPSDEYDSSGVREIMVTDPDEIDQLKKAVVGTGRRYYNQVFSMSDIDVDITVADDGTMQNYRAGFPRGKVPGFVIERLMAAKPR